MRQIKVKSINEIVEITGEDAKHLIYSLRSKTGERLTVIDEANQRALVELIKFSKEKVTAQLIEKLPQQQSELITLAVSIPKNNFDTIIRQATEIGVAAIQPLITERTILKPSAAKCERWQRIAKEAAQQSGAIEPTIMQIKNFTDWLKEKSDEQLIVCSEAENKKNITDIKITNKTTIVIGCEGGFTSEEFKQLNESGAISVSLGSNILRVDTAAITALAIIKHLSIL